MRDLLTHMSGLRPDLDLGDDVDGLRRRRSRCATEEVLTRRPAGASSTATSTSFCSREIVARVSEAAARRVRARRRSSRRSACARRCSSRRPRWCRASRRRRRARRATSRAAASAMLRGVVHDPTARRMGGVAGHAGLFSTAADLTIFCRMLLGGGAVGHDARALAADGRAHDVAGDAGRRAERPRARLGSRLVVLGQSRRAAAARLVRAHGIHGHVALDRSGDARVHRLPVEPRASGWHGRRHAAARAGRDDRRRRR